ncbi:ABC transporter permease subunit [Chloroflexales bacterium ZM16-3]|nr:ABC transporter permease subunit [Chloroflexales bacterium ZM16-3]
MIRRNLLGPVLFKELATLLRGSRAALMITVYVGMVLISARLFYGVTASQLDFGQPLLSAQIGQVIFIGVSLVIQTMTLFLAPATTLSAVSHEYERGTFELIQATPLSASQLIIDKLIAAMAFLLLLLIAAMPAFTLVLLFGGLMISDLVPVVIVILMTAVVGCAFGLFCSAVTRQTFNATLLCYAVLISLVGGTLFAASIWSLINGLSAAPPSLVVANPLSAIATVLAPIRPPDDSFTGGFRPLVLLSLLSRGVIDNRGVIAPTYHATAVIYGALTISLIWGTLVAVRPRLRLTREDGVMLAALLVYGLLAYMLRGWWVPGIFP